MSIPAHTNAFGEHWHWRDDILRYRATLGDGTPYQEDRPIWYWDAVSKRYPPNKQAKFVPGTSIRLPKDYDRYVGRITEFRPWAERNGNYDDAFDETIERQFEGMYPDVPLHPGHHGISENNKAAADVKALNNLRSGNAIELGTDLAESRSTLNMIASRTSSVLKALQALKRGRLQDIPRHLGVDARRLSNLRAPADIWLEYQYGWKPLMGTIHDGAKLLDEGFRKPQLYWAKGTSNVNYDHYDEGDDSRRAYGVLGCKTGICYRVSSAQADMFANAGLNNPLSIAWEVVPFSFVLDWFIPVGNVLSALTATAGLDFVYGYRTERRHSQHEWKKLKISGSSRPTEHWSLVRQGYCHAETFHMLRRALTSFPRPQFYANANPFSTERVGSALALLRQLF